jgi:uncharacterized protein (TIGR03086 family)
MRGSEAERHRWIAATFTARVHGVRDWGAPSPVAAWSARDIVEHLVTWSSGFLAAGGEDLPEGPEVAGEPVAAWEHHVAAVQALLDAADADRAFTHPELGAMPLAQAVDRFYTTDVFLHTWDLATATGQDARLDPDECAALLAGMEPVAEVLRSSGHYGPAVAVPDDAPVQDRLIGFIGRDPQWSPRAA